MNSEDANAPGGPPVDLVWLSECTDGDAEAMKAMVDLYQNRTAVQLGELDAAIAADSATDVRRIAHACVGSSGTCGMGGMAQIFKRLEKMGGSGKLVDAAPIAAEARAEFERVKQFLAEKVGR
jgi:HPt (histidine-containing phosphotransfer) domain-containing protein